MCSWGWDVHVILNPMPIFTVNWRVEKPCRQVDGFSRRFSSQKNQVIQAAREEVSQK